MRLRAEGVKWKGEGAVDSKSLSIHRKLCNKTRQKWLDLDLEKSIIWKHNGDKVDFSNGKTFTVNSQLSCGVMSPFFATWAPTSCDNSFSFICEQRIE